MINIVEPVTLTGKHVQLELLRSDHHANLLEATSDGELWKLWYTNIPSPEHMHEEVDRRLALHHAGTMLPFAVRSLVTGKVVGMTTYMNIDPRNRRVEIGSTWYARSVQRTGLNTECKLMLLTHAFETLGCIAVEFRTGSFNFQSRKAIERIGAKMDGVLRNHMVMPNSTMRDTCVYSILPSEWPAVKAHLQFRLAQAAQL